MKFFTPFLTALAATSALGLTIPTKRQETGVDDYSYLGTNPIFPIKKECSDAIEKLTNENKECTVNPENKNEDELKSFCNTFNSEKCQKFINTKFADIPECKSSIAESLTLMDEATKTKYSGYKLICAVDEQGNFCPMTDIEMAKKYNETMTKEQEEKAYDEVLKETCKSKKCADTFLTAFEDLEKTQKELQERLSKLDSKVDLTDELKTDSTISKALTYLKSDECAVEIKSSGSADAKSDAINTITYSSTLFVAIALLLLNF